MLSMPTGASAFGEKYSVTPFYGYQFGGHLAVRNGELQLDDTENYGVSLDVYHSPITTMQFLYIYQDTSLQLKNYFTGMTTELFDLTVEYFHLGGTRVLNKGGGTTSFVSGSLGATHFSPSESGYSDETLFSMSFGMGVIKEIRKNISLRIQGRLLMPIQTAGGGVFCGGGGCSAHVSGGTSIMQGDITAGIQFQF